MIICFSIYVKIPYLLYSWYSSLCFLDLGKDKGRWAQIDGSLPELSGLSRLLLLTSKKAPTLSGAVPKLVPFYCLLFAARLYGRKPEIFVLLPKVSFIKPLLSSKCVCNRHGGSCIPTHL